MNKRVKSLFNSNNCNCLKTILNQYSTTIGFSTFIEGLVKEVKACALADMSYESLTDALNDFKVIQDFIKRKEICEQYGSLTRLKSFIDETENYISDLLEEHFPKENKDNLQKRITSNNKLIKDFLDILTLSKHWVGESFSDFILALCIASFDEAREGVIFFNEKYAEKLNVERINEIPVFDSSKLKTLEGCLFKVENTDVKIEFPRRIIRNNAGGKVGEYFVFFDFEKSINQDKLVLTSSIAGFEACYTTTKPLEKTDISCFKKNLVIKDAERAFKNLACIVSNACDNLLPRQEVSKIASKHSIYHPQLHPTTEFFVGEDKNYKFKISITAEGPSNYHTVKIKGELFFCHNNC